MVSVDPKKDYRESTCRTCLSRFKPTDLISIFKQTIADETILRYSEMLEAFTYMEIYPDDEFPKSVCEVCATHIKNCYLFKKKCEKSFLVLVQQCRTYYREINKDKLEKFNIIDIIKTEKDSVLFVCECGGSFFSEDAFNDHQSAAHWNVTEKKDKTVKVRIKQEPPDTSSIRNNTIQRNNDVNNRNIPMVRISQRLSNDSVDTVSSRFRSSSSSSVEPSKSAEVNNNSKNSQKTNKKVSIDSGGDSGISGENEEVASIISNDDRDDDMFDNDNDELLDAIDSDATTETNDGSYICNVCLKGFKAAKYLRRHMISHVGNFKCEHCLKVYMEERNLERHLRVKHSNEHYIEYKTKHLLQNKVVKVQLEHVEVPTCKYCDTTFWSKNVLAKHERICNSETHDCKHCHERFETLSELSEHCKLIHEKRAPKQTFPCGECDSTYSSYKNLEYHMIWKHPEVVNPNEFKCIYCSKCFDEMRRLRIHLGMKHQGERTPSPPPEVQEVVITPAPEPPKERILQITDCYEMYDEIEKTVKCNQCHKIFSKKKFRTHYIQHSNVIKYKCDFCLYDFIGAEFLRNHMKQNHPDELVCKICRIQVRNKNLFEAHMKTHGVEKEEGPSAKKPKSTSQTEAKTDSTETPYCTICDRDFSNTHNLQLHNRYKHPELVVVPHESKHEKQEEFIIPDDSTKPSEDLCCKDCDRVFRSKESYTAHRQLQHEQDTAELRSTSEILPVEVQDKQGYICEICDEVKARRDYLKPHFKHTHPGEFRCSLCNVQFFNYLFFKIHMATHGPEHHLDKKSGFSCKFCCRKFTIKANLDSHMKTKHGLGFKYKNFCDACSVINPEDRHETHPHHKKLVIAYEDMRSEIDNTRFFGPSKSGSLECKICQKTFKKSANLYIHLKVHPEVRIFQCDTCTNTYIFEKSLRKHYSAEHPEESEEPPAKKVKAEEKASQSKPELEETIMAVPKKIGKSYLKFIGKTKDRKLKCRLCFKLYTQQKSILSHFLTKHKDKVPALSCKQCKRRFINEDALDRHEKSMHLTIVDDDDEVNEGKNGFTCMLCKAIFSRVSSFSQHLIVHDKENPNLQCGFCLKAHNTEDGLRKHLITHFDKHSLIQCKICCLVYHTKQGLQRHMAKWHSSKNPKKDLPSHHQIESQKEEEPECSEKDDEEPAPSDIKMKFFKCKDCDKIFKRLDYLHLHINFRHKKGEQKPIKKVVTPPIPIPPSSRKSRSSTPVSTKSSPQAPTPEDLTCNLCFKEFRSISNLNQHKENHKVEIDKNIGQNLECDDCKLKFKTLKTLTNHKKFFCYWSTHKAKKEKSEKSVITIKYQTNTAEKTFDESVEENDTVSIIDESHGAEIMDETVSTENDTTFEISTEKRSLSKDSLMNGFKEIAELEGNILHQPPIEDKVINFDSLEKMVNEIVQQLDDDESQDSRKKSENDARSNSIQETEEKKEKPPEISEEKMDVSENSIQVDSCDKTDESKETSPEEKNIPENNEVLEDQEIDEKSTANENLDKPDLSVEMETDVETQKEADSSETSVKLDSAGSGSIHDKESNSESKEIENKETEIDSDEIVNTKSSNENHQKLPEIISDVVEETEENSSKLELNSVDLPTVNSESDRSENSNELKESSEKCEDLPDDVDQDDTPPKKSDDEDSKIDTEEKLNQDDSPQEESKEISEEAKVEINDNENNSMNSSAKSPEIPKNSEEETEMNDKSLENENEVESSKDEEEKFDNDNPGDIKVASPLYVIDDDIFDDMFEDCPNVMSPSSQEKNGNELELENTEEKVSAEKCNEAEIASDFLPAKDIPREPSETNFDDNLSINSELHISNSEQNQSNSECMDEDECLDNISFKTVSEAVSFDDIALLDKIIDSSVHEDQEDQEDAFTANSMESSMEMEQTNVQ